MKYLGNYIYDYAPSFFGEDFQSNALYCYKSFLSRDIKKMRFDKNKSKHFYKLEAFC